MMTARTHERANQQPTGKTDERQDVESEKAWSHEARVSLRRRQTRWRPESPYQALIIRARSKLPVN